MGDHNHNRDHDTPYTLHFFINVDQRFLWVFYAESALGTKGTHAPSPEFAAYCTRVYGPALIRAYLYQHVHGGPPPSVLPDSLAALRDAYYAALCYVMRERLPDLHHSPARLQCLLAALERGPLTSICTFVGDLPQSSDGSGYCDVVTVQHLIDNLHYETCQLLIATDVLDEQAYETCMSNGAGAQSVEAGDSS